MTADRDEEFRGPIVVVDVQPFYCAQWEETGRLMEQINAHRGPVYLLVNAEETGVCPDSLSDCREFWIENGLEHRTLAYARVLDKGFGYLRSWMDSGVDQDVTVAVIKGMREEGLRDSRDLDPGVLQEIAGPAFQDWMLNEPLSIGWISELDLEGMRGAQICGGARDERLAEVELLLRAYDIPFERMEEFVYSDLPTLELPGRRW